MRPIWWKIRKYAPLRPSSKIHLHLRAPPFNLQN